MAAKASRLLLHFVNIRYFLSFGSFTHNHLTRQTFRMSPDCGQFPNARYSRGTHSSQE
jgi:hypothetical protein